MALDDKSEHQAEPGEDAADNATASDGPGQNADPQVVTHPGLLTARNLRLTAIGLIGPILAIAAGLGIYLYGGQVVTTDNAYLKSHKIAVSADVSGRVDQVFVKANQEVRAGAPLFQIDPRPFEIALIRANARYAAARQEIQALKAVYEQKRANITRAEGDAKFFEAQSARQKALVQKRIVSQTAFDTAMNDLRDARDKVAIARQDVAEARAKLGGDPEVPVDEHPRVLEALAAKAQAQLDVDRTKIAAPTDGIITNFELQKGEYIKAGDVIFSLVGSSDLWVEANYKETELTHVRVGQSATISVDAYPGKPRKAVVASISPATGAEFALLPPQNATGNWVKVVQRLTVRLKLEQPEAEPPLRAGMSVIASIDTGHKRRLSGIFTPLAQWIGPTKADEPQ